ncbi:Terminase small subunit (DNA packaging protein Nu1) [Fodinicurvata sp. EGI_FJ10296]|uniref:Terminase small subunit (DNA packaging protein Nu1) n=1 Tax=Fodinicurvata sp. EGI_FJ10296 TaxID=3231908 RepID=UPI003456C7F8
MAGRTRRASGKRTESLVNAAAILGLHRNTLAQWIKQGCPVVTEADRSQGIEWAICVADVVEWRIRTAVEDALSGYDSGSDRISRDEADRRRAVAQAITAEVEADQALDQVVDRGDAEADIATFCAGLRAGLSNAAAKIASRTVTMESAPEIQDLVLGELNRAFNTAEAELAEQWALAATEDGDPETTDDAHGNGGGTDRTPPSG